MSKNTKEIALTMNTTVDADSVDKLKRLEHHIEWLLDLDNWLEIQSVYGVKVEEVKG